MGRSYSRHHRFCSVCHGIRHTVQRSHGRLKTYPSDTQLSPLCPDLMYVAIVPGLNLFSHKFTEMRRKLIVHFESCAEFTHVHSGISDLRNVDLKGHQFMKS